MPLPPSSTLKYAEEQATSQRIAQQIEKDQSTTSAKLAALVTSASEKLGIAQSVVDQATTLEAYKIGKEAMASLLAPIKEVVEVLNIVSDIHPAVKAVAGVLQVIIKMQIDRHENDKNIAVLHFTMSDFLFHLAYLDPVFSTMDTLQALLDKYLAGVKETMNGFGNFCDVYYKHGSLVRVLRSNSYKGKLAEFATAFQTHKSDLQFLMANKTAVSVTNVELTVGDVNNKVDIIVAFIETQTGKDKAAAEKVAQLGGVDRVLQDSDLLKDLAKGIGEEITAQMTFALHADLDSLLESNLGLFSLKVESVVYQMKEAVERSTDVIISKLDSGPYELIDDEDVRQVWKDMNWRVSCKGRHFVDAMHQHFGAKFANYRYSNGEVHPHAWTLQFISKVIFYPAIGDAIDEDGSGYISIHEVNHFVKSKPEKWSLPEWLAYWAVGWYQNTLHHVRAATKSGENIEEQAKNILKENIPLLQNSDYLKQEYGIKDLWLIIDSIYVDNLSWHGESIDVDGAYEKLKILREERMHEEKEAMRARLLKTKYQLDSRPAVLAILGHHKVESSIMCLVELLLERHLKIIQLAKKFVLSDQEFENMERTTFAVTDTFERRLTNLKEAWRQQRLDIKLQLYSFAGGIFEDWHENYFEDEDSDSSSESGDEDEDSDESGFEDDDTPASPTTVLSYQDADTPENLLLYPLPTQPKQEELQVAGEGDDEQEDEEEEETRAKKPSVKRRLAAIEDRLTNIEDMLSKIVETLTKTKVKDQKEVQDEEVGTECGSDEEENDGTDEGDDEEAEEED